MTTETRVSAMTILPEGKPLFDEMATTVRVEDDAAGAYLVIEQCRDSKGSQIVTFDFTEVSALCQAMIRLRDEWEPSK